MINPAVVNAIPVEVTSRGSILSESLPVTGLSGRVLYPSLNAEFDRNNIVSSSSNGMAPLRSGVRILNYPIRLYNI